MSSTHLSFLRLGQLGVVGVKAWTTCNAIFISMVDGHVRDAVFDPE